MLPLSKWREAVGDKAVHFLLHTSLRHVRSLLVLFMMTVLCVTPFFFHCLVDRIILMPLSMSICVIF
jgi:hypothetical protein